MIKIISCAMFEGFGDSGYISLRQSATVGDGVYPAMDYVVALYTDGMWLAAAMGNVLRVPTFCGSSSILHPHYKAVPLNHTADTVPNWMKSELWEDSPQYVGAMSPYVLAAAVSNLHHVHQPAMYGPCMNVDDLDSAAAGPTGIACSMQEASHYTHAVQLAAACVKHATGSNVVTVAVPGYCDYRSRYSTRLDTFKAYDNYRYVTCQLPDPHDLAMSVARNPNSGNTTAIFPWTVTHVSGDTYEDAPDYARKLGISRSTAMSLFARVCGGLPDGNGSTRSVRQHLLESGIFAQLNTVDPTHRLDLDCADALRGNFFDDEEEEDDDDYENEEYEEEEEIDWDNE